jgi:hypothetical protein
MSLEPPLRWREILIGAVITLAVTTVSGIVAYYATRESPGRERLVYTIDAPSAFETDTTHFTIQNIGVANTGQSAAKHVEVVIDASQSGADIKDQSVVPSSGPASGILVEDYRPKSLSLGLNSLIPKEQIKVTLLLTSKPKGPLVVSVKSDESTATLESSLVQTPSAQEKTLKILAVLSTALLSGLVAAIAVYFATKKLLST